MLLYIGRATSYFIVLLLHIELKGFLFMNKNLEQILSDIITIVGVPANIKGYKYLRDAIYHVVKDINLASKLTKSLYPLIASENNTSASRVEKAIRHAIEVGYNAGKMTNLNTIFGLEIFNTYDKPSNGEFIALVADRLILNGYNLKENN